MRTNVSYGDKDYFALQIFNGLFGGFHTQNYLLMYVKRKPGLLCREPFRKP